MFGVVLADRLWRLKGGAREVVTVCHGLNLLAADGCWMALLFVEPVQADATDA